MKRDFLVKADLQLIRFIQKISLPLARIALFLVFFWFGFLKVLELSPADGIVQALFDVTFLPSVISFSSFFIFLGILEMIIGSVFLVKGAERLAIALLVPHMITTILPLFYVPDAVWVSTLVPTLAGQYIIKNIVLVALGIGISAHLTPWKKHHN